MTRRAVLAACASVLADGKPRTVRQIVDDSSSAGIDIGTKSKKPASVVARDLGFAILRADWPFERIAKGVYSIRPEGVECSCHCPTAKIAKDRREKVLAAREAERLRGIARRRREIPLSEVVMLRLESAAKARGLSANRLASELVDLALMAPGGQRGVLGLATVTKNTGGLRG